jgi:hypothetical protein
MKKQRIRTKEVHGYFLTMYLFYSSCKICRFSSELDNHINFKGNEDDFMSVINQIKNTIPIIDALERYTVANFKKVRTSRLRFNISCPFHNDRNPSFTVYTDTNTFRCWSGCNDGKRGDVIEIVKLSQNVGTKKAIDILISEYGLEQPDSEQAIKWEKKRAGRKRDAAIQKGLNKKVLESITLLKNLEEKANSKLTTIKTNEDLQLEGDLYHVITQINYWQECLIDDDPVIRFQTLREIKHFSNCLTKNESESST